MSIEDNPAIKIGILHAEMLLNHPDSYINLLNKSNATLGAALIAYYELLRLKKIEPIEKIPIEMKLQIFEKAKEWCDVLKWSNDRLSKFSRVVWMINFFTE